MIMNIKNRLKVLIMIVINDHIILKGCCPLHTAIQNGNDEVTCVLIKNKANGNAENKASRCKYELKNEYKEGIT